MYQLSAPARLPAFRGTEGGIKDNSATLLVTPPVTHTPRTPTTTIFEDKMAVLNAGIRCVIRQRHSDMVEFQRGLSTSP